MISGHVIPHHLNDYDNQMSASFASGDLTAALNSLQSCLASVQSCMSTNILKLDPDKTEFILIGNERQRSKYLTMFSTELFSVQTKRAKSAQNLEVIFGKNVTFRSHIWAVCSSCFYHMSDVRHIRRYLDLDSAILLAIALVSSRLHYCNSLLYGIMNTDLTKLQRIQNRLAHFVTKSPPFTCSSVPLLRSLYWLSVKYRILFKISLLTYTTIHEEQLVYIHSMLAASLPSRSLRLNKGIILLFPRVKTNRGARFFHSWNNLPLPVRSVISVATFNKHLKTNLWLGLSSCPIDTGTPNGPLILQNCFFNFTVEDRFGCCAIEPGFVGDMGTMEIWLIDRNGGHHVLDLLNTKFQWHNYCITLKVC